MIHLTHLLAFAVIALGCGTTGPDAAPDVDATTGSLDAGVSNDARPESTPEPSLRILSYNIKHAELSSLEDIAAVIRDSDADIVALQEVDKNAARSGNVDQAFRLGQLTGMASSFRAAITLADGGAYGLAILSRYPVLSSEKVNLTSAGEQRIAILWELDFDDGVFVHFGVTHLGLTVAERTTQAAEVVELARDATYALVLGDFNEEPDGGDMHSTMLAGGFRDAHQVAGDGPGFTFPGVNPDRRIDYAFIGSGWANPTFAEVIEGPASDHAALLVELPAP